MTLYADSLHSVWDAYSANTYKLWGLILYVPSFIIKVISSHDSFDISLVPTVFLPLSVLSYTSILGIFSTLLIILVVLIDGFTKKDSPGSLLHPAETSFSIRSWKGLGVSFGLFMAGVSSFDSCHVANTNSTGALVFWPCGHSIPSTRYGKPVRFQ